MITFIEWVDINETVKSILSRMLREGAGGAALNFNSAAKDLVHAIQSELIKNKDLPEAIRTAASQIDKNNQLAPSDFGNKLRAALVALSPNDQQDVLQDMMIYFLQYMRGNKLSTFKHINDSFVDPDSLAVWVISNFMIGVKQKIKEFYRSRSRRDQRGKPMTDITGWEGVPPEGSYEDKEEEEISGLTVTPGSWNKAIELVMHVQDNMYKEISDKEAKQQDKEYLKTAFPDQMDRTNFKNAPTKLNTKRANKLTITLSLMRNLPHQMATQLGANDNNLIYDKLKKMVLDKDSELGDKDSLDKIRKSKYNLKHGTDDRSDSDLLKHWADFNSSKDQEQRSIIATALWVSNGMKIKDKPKKALDYDDNTNAWFLDEIEKLDVSRDDDDMSYGVHVPHSGQHTDMPEAPYHPDEPDEPEAPYDPDEPEVPFEPDDDVAKYDDESDEPVKPKRKRRPKDHSHLFEPEAHEDKPELMGKTKSAPLERKPKRQHHENPNQPSLFDM